MSQFADDAAAMLEDLRLLGEGVQVTFGGTTVDGVLTDEEVLEVEPSSGIAIQARPRRLTIATGGLSGVAVGSGVSVKNAAGTTTTYGVRRIEQEDDGVLTDYVVVVT